MLILHAFQDKDPITKKQFYYMVPASQAGNRLLIPDKFKQIFAAKQITCGEFTHGSRRSLLIINLVEFRDIDASIERDIFQRVQLGVPLTSAGGLPVHYDN